MVFNKPSCSPFVLGEPCGYSIYCYNIYIYIYIYRFMGRYIKDWDVKSNMAGPPSSAKFAGCNQQFSGATALSTLKAAGLVTIHFDARQSA